MEAKDTVKTENELCILVCQEYRHDHLEGKNCDGLDCGACQLLAQAEISFPLGKQEGRQEVVEWVDRNMWKQGSIERWQAQKKRWGIE